MTETHTPTKSAYSKREIKPLTAKALSFFNSITQPVSLIQSIITDHDKPHEKHTLHRITEQTEESSFARSTSMSSPGRLSNHKSFLSAGSPERVKSPSPTLDKIKEEKSKGTESVRTLVEFFSTKTSVTKESISLPGSATRVNVSSPKQEEVKPPPVAAEYPQVMRTGTSGTTFSTNSQARKQPKSSVDENTEIAKKFREAAANKSRIENENRAKALERKRLDDERQAAFNKYKDETRSRTSVESRLTATSKLLKAEKERLAIVEAERRIQEEIRKEKQRIAKEKQQEEIKRLKAEREARKAAEAAKGTSDAPPTSPTTVPILSPNESPIRPSIPSDPVQLPTSETQPASDIPVPPPAPLPEKFRKDSFSTKPRSSSMPRVPSNTAFPRVSSNAYPRTPSNANNAVPRNPSNVGAAVPRTPSTVAVPRTPSNISTASASGKGTKKATIKKTPSTKSVTQLLKGSGQQTSQPSSRQTLSNASSSHSLNEDQSDQYTRKRASTEANGIQEAQPIGPAYVEKKAFPRVLTAIAEDRLAFAYMMSD